MDLEIVAVGLLGPLAIEVFRFFERRYNAWQAEKKTASESFEAALSSDDINTLGKYFNENFSPVKLSTYTTDSAIKERINTYLRRIGDFVEATPEEIASLAGSESDFSAPSQAVEPVPSTIQPVESVAVDPAPLLLAAKSIMAGDSWSGLARVRRDLEKELRRRTPDAGRMPLVRLAQLVEMPPEIMRSFREFSSIANAAVHGSDIGPTDALKALDDARKVYRFLQNTDVQVRDQAV